MDELFDFMKSFWGIVSMLLLTMLFLLICFRLLFVNFVDNYEIGYIYDLRTGATEHLSRNGYVVTPPFVKKVHKIDGRPMQVCISSISRVLNCKLVQFNLNGLELFLKWHGRGDYDNDGTPQNPSVFNEILKAYAYEGSGKSYPFLTIIRELKPTEVEEQR